MQDKLGKQNVYFDTKDVFEPVIRVSKATVKEKAGAVTKTTEAIEFKKEETIKAIHETGDTSKSKEDIMNNANYFDSRSVPASPEFFNSKNKNRFRSRVNPKSPKDGNVTSTNYG